ncbi:hypothetical protein D5086_015621 [Populus alba]|uniref:Uncharacterized protein n=1 Tax=Populus alba TaxID=43335 RepID=A0ACC4BT78_POPAL
MQIFFRASNLLHATHCIIKEWGKNGKPGTKISSEESQRTEQQQDPMKYLHGVVAVHTEPLIIPLLLSPKLDQTAENVWVMTKT